jgi:hypothetical protein
MGLRWCRLVLVLVFAGGVKAQEVSEPRLEYSRVNSWTVFMEGSPTSSHILLGTSRNRIFATLGGSYARRFLRTPNTSLSYVAEVRPVEFLGEPFVRETTVSTYILGLDQGQTFVSTNSFVAVGKCSNNVTNGTYGLPPYGNEPGTEIAYSVIIRCGWRWTFGQTIVPVGLKYSFRTQRRLQPYAVLFGGYMYTSRPVPDETASPFNFVFGTGAGLELYRAEKRSVSVEARWQHFSNNNTAENNPGVDSIMYRLSYSFGR